MELTLIIFIPAIVAAGILLLPDEMEDYSRWLALGASLIVLVLSAALFVQFENGEPGYQFVVRETWVDVGSFQLNYALGVDGLSMPLLALTSLLTVASVLVSFSIKERQRLYYALLLLLATSVFGVFAALDFLLFFLFWELELAPMFLLIAVWGSGRKEYAATKFVLYTIAGSALMLIAILALCFSAGTFDIEQLTNSEFNGAVLPLRVIFVL
ncbi:MAG: NADH-quinone oxidoreductase subunit M, partial [Dehalococcoidia bacterium]|nr:NADH-quinone oxidoreductase subunit M [Dehalococcoidia bacterium]